jgi:hypothetical protein
MGSIQYPFHAIHLEALIGNLLLGGGDGFLSS